MIEYAKRKELLGKYEGVEIPNPDRNNPIPEMINFDASGFVTLRYNYKENEDEEEFKCREVRLYYSYEGSGPGLANGKVKSMDSPRENDKPEKLPNSFEYSIELKEEQMDKVIEKIDSFNHSRYQLFSNNRIDFLKAVSKEVQSSSSISSFSSSQIEQLQLLEQAYEKSNVRNGLLRYKRGDMSRTSSFLTAYDIKTQLGNLANEYTYRTSQRKFDELEKMSKEYVSVVDKANEYLKNTNDSEEERQNKALVQALLNEYISAYIINLHSAAEDISSQLSDLGKQCIQSSKKFRLDKLHKFITLSKEYVEKIDKAREYLKNVGDSKEEQQEKLTVKWSLDMCIKNYKTSSSLIAKGIADKLDSLANECINRSKNSEFDNFERISKEYVLKVNKAQQYLKNMVDLKEELQNKDVIQAALDKCIKAYRTSSTLLAKGMADKLDSLASAYRYRSEDFKFDEFKKMSQEYVSVVDKARVYLKNVDDSEEERQNKVLIQVALDKYISAYKTNSFLAAQFIKDKLDRLTEEQSGLDRGKKTSTLDEVKETSQRYVSAVDEANEYLKNAGDSEEERQNKALVQAALDKCKSAYGGSMQDKVSDESVLDDSSIEIKTGEDDVDMFLSQDMLDVRDWPLFPWRPCISDIKQGYIADCWLEAALASLVHRDPKYIEDSLRDNHDGTVTGRIYDKDENNKSVKPRYYRVTKSIPHLSGTNNPAFSKNACLWPEMIRKILIKHIVDKGGKKVRNGDMVTNPTYRLLAGGTVANPLTQIFQFFTPNYKEVKVHNNFRINIILSMIKYIATKGVLNSNQKESIVKSFLKYCATHSETNVISRYLDLKPGISPEQVKSNIEEYANKLITYDEFLERCSPLMEHDILSDESIFKLLNKKEVREGASSDISEILKKYISKDLCYIIVKRFQKSDGLMTASTVRCTDDLDEYSDILGEIAKPNSVGRREKELAGLYTNHAYTVIGLEKKNGHYLVKIRNPWGDSNRYDDITSDGKLRSRSNDGNDVGRVEILEFLKYFKYLDYLE